MKDFLPSAVYVVYRGRNALKEKLGSAFLSEYGIAS